ncbi:MAG: YrhA family protein [Lachnospiraceae bacterium]|nr:YrhA family protein [Lachnospiraceae bacterium]
MDREAILNLLDEIYPTNALIIKPAGEFEINRCQEDLKGIEVPELPDGYIEFLTEIANGFAWNGFEFFGTYQVTVKKSGYKLIDIVQYNYKLKYRKEGLKNKLVLGRFDDDIYIYNTKTRKYQALDALTLIEIESYDSFEDMFIENVSAYIYDDDEEDDEDYED